MLTPPYTPEDLGISGELRYETLDPQIPQNDRVHYQRRLSLERVHKFLGESHKDLRARTGLLSYHPDGTYWVIDGQHHTEAAVRLEIDILGYWVFDSDSWEKDKVAFNRFAAWKESQGKPSKE